MIDSQVRAAYETNSGGAQMNGAVGVYIFDPCRRGWQQSQLLTIFIEILNEVHIFRGWTLSDKNPPALPVAGKVNIGFNKGHEVVANPSTDGIGRMERNAYKPHGRHMPEQDYNKKPAAEELVGRAHGEHVLNGMGMYNRAVGGDSRQG